MVYTLTLPIITYNRLGLFSEKSASRKGTYIDCLCDLMQEKLKYEEHEKDMIILHHIFGVEWNNGSQVNFPAKSIA
jgi:hypothetical protein